MCETPVAYCYIFISKLSRRAGGDDDFAMTTYDSDGPPNCCHVTGVFGIPCQNPTGMAKVQPKEDPLTFRLVKQSLDPPEGDSCLCKTFSGCVVSNEKIVVTQNTTVASEVYENSVILCGTGEDKVQS